jgi:hemerythrin-like domain-containing protein
VRSLNETTQLVRDEHKKLRGLFRQLEVLRFRSPGMLTDVIRETCNEVQIYLELEEKLLFPKVHSFLKAKTRLETPETEFIHEAMSEHRQISQAIRALRGQIDSREPTEMASDWDAMIDELVNSTEAYIYGEEQNLLPFIERHLPAVDASLSMSWFDKMDEIRSRIHATTPADPRHAQNPNGGEQIR